MNCPPSTSVVGPLDGAFARLARSPCLPRCRAGSARGPSDRSRSWPAWIIAALAVSVANIIEREQSFHRGLPPACWRSICGGSRLWRPAPLIYMVPPCTVTASGATLTLRLSRATRDWGSSPTASSPAGADSSPTPARDAMRRDLTRRRRHRLPGAPHHARSHRLPHAPGVRRQSRPRIRAASERRLLRGDRPARRRHPVHGERHARGQ